MQVKKEREKEQEATHIENTQRLVTEIEMLKVVSCIWCAEIIEEVKLARRRKQKARKIREVVGCVFVCQTRCICYSLLLATEALSP